MPKQRLFTEWGRILDVSVPQTDIRAARTERERAYIVKYTAKAAEFKDDGSDVVAWYLATKGLRLFATFGDWYNAKIEELLDADEDLEFTPACPNCGETGTVFYARDGPYVFGHEVWRDVESFHVKGQPLERKVDDDRELMLI